MKLRDEIESLALAAAARNAALTAEAVVEAARDATRFPALNGQLWQVAESALANEARLNRAHRLIIRLTVTTESGANVRAFLHTRTERGYRPSATIAASVNLAAIKLAELQSDIARSRARLAAFRSVLDPDVADAIEAAIAETSARIDEARRSAGAMMQQVG